MRFLGPSIFHPELLASLSSDPVKVGKLPVNFSYGLTLDRKTANTSFNQSEQTGYGLRLQSQLNPTRIDRSTQLNASVSVSQLYGTNVSRGLTLLGSASVTRQLGSSASMVATYDYTQDPFSAGLLGKHRLSLQAFYNSGRTGFTFFGNRSLDIDRLSYYADVNYRISGLWRFLGSYTFDKYLTDFLISTITQPLHTASGFGSLASRGLTEQSGLAFRFWVRPLISALLCAFLATWVQADGFGRFGYVEKPTLPGIEVDKDGFVSKTPNSDKFYFSSPGVQWKPATTNESGQTILLSAKALGPQKLRYSLWQPGISLLFQEGLQFRLGSTGCPYLTWSEGTVGEAVPTPETSWVLISFRTPQPPILIVLESGVASFQFAGRAGSWTLKTEKPVKGWVRIIQPLGTTEVAANTAAALGKLNKRVFENISIWTQPAPQLLSHQVKGDATSVEATWQFDRQVRLYR